MPDQFIPPRCEDSEREKLPELAKELGWRFESQGNEEYITGKLNNKKFSIGVQRRKLFHDVVEYRLEAPSKLIGTICRENLFTKGGQVLAKTLSQLGIAAKCDIQTGDDYIDKNFFFEVRNENREYMELLLKQKESLPLLKQILSYFDQINFTENDIFFYKFIANDDLSSETVTKSLKWINDLDRLDGIYY